VDRPTQLKRWWIPVPTRCRAARLEVVPGGGLVAAMSEDGIEFEPHLEKGPCLHEETSFGLVAQLAGRPEARPVTSDLKLL